MVFLSRPREAQLTTSDPLYSEQSTPLLHISSILTDMIDAYFCRCNGLESKRQTFLAKHNEGGTGTLRGGACKGWLPYAYRNSRNTSYAGWLQITNGPRGSSRVVTTTWCARCGGTKAISVIACIRSNAMACSS